MLKINTNFIIIIIKESRLEITFFQVQTHLVHINHNYTVINYVKKKKLHNINHEYLVCVVIKILIS